MATCVPLCKPGQHRDKSDEKTRFTGDSNGNDNEQIDVQELDQFQFR